MCMSQIHAIPTYYVVYILYTVLSELSHKPILARLIFAKTFLAILTAAIMELA